MLDFYQRQRPTVTSKSVCNTTVGQNETQQKRPRLEIANPFNFLVGPQEPLPTTVNYENSPGSGMSRSMTASPESSSRAPWRVGDAVVGRGNAGRTTSKSGRPWRYKN